MGAARQGPAPPRLADRLRRIWGIGIALLIALATVASLLRRAPQPALQGEAARAQPVAPWAAALGLRDASDLLGAALVAVLVVLVLLSVRALLQARSGSPVTVRVDLGAAADDAVTLETGSRTAKVRTPDTQRAAAGPQLPETAMEAPRTAPACARCGAPATGQFGYTGEPVCDACMFKPGVCSSCGKDFGSDAVLIPVGQYKNCRECDARLDAEIDGGFSSTTRIRR